MNTRTKIGIGLALLLVGLTAVRLGLFSKGPSDQEAIKTAMAEAIQAGKDGRPGPVLDFLSDRLAVNGQAVFSKRQIAQYVHDNHPEVTVLNSEPEVSGDSATILTPVNVKLALPGGIPFERQFTDVTLMFRREDTVTWLIFPGKTWRLSKVSAPGSPSFGEDGQ